MCDVLDREDNVLWYFLTRSKFDSAKALIENGACVRIKHQQTPRNTMLMHVSSVNCDGSLFNIILDKSIQENIVDNQNIRGYTALIYACETATLHTEKVKFLLKANAYPNFQTTAGLSAMMLSLKSPLRYELVKMLLNVDADVGIVDNSGNTILMHACRFSDLEIVLLLLESGKDVGLNLVNKHGYTALMLACLNKVCFYMDFNSGICNIHASLIFLTRNLLLLFRD
eukprot:TRINITY_DN3257_c0_g1_i3.p1 TRINITY_DN3257_c0_g1~~TRINITY_DN3257_c0_g1_i3.p1  ORF type:complete len:227 (-),score=24.11 TRINITY_DN3257_c0_g1_i3:37-717(-)